MSDSNVLGGAEIWGDSTRNHWEGPTERETRTAIEEIEEDTPLTGTKRTLKQLALSLAASIDKGNVKGRAIANEAAQLFAMMQQLEPPATDDAPDDSKFTPETRRLLDAFAATPALDPAPEGDEAGLQPTDAG